MKKVYRVSRKQRKRMISSLREMIKFLKGIDKKSVVDFSFVRTRVAEEIMPIQDFFKEFEPSQETDYCIKFKTFSGKIVEEDD